MSLNVILKYFCFQCDLANGTGNIVRVLRFLVHSHEKFHDFFSAKLTLDFLILALRNLDFQILSIKLALCLLMVVTFLILWFNLFIL
jgi:hypothetical protein